MSGLGKKILSAFLEVTPTPPKATENPQKNPGTGEPSRNLSRETPENAHGGAEGQGRPAADRQAADPASHGDSRFSEYFDKLFSEANMPGPDYYEFSKMIGAMQSMTDERSRFDAAYAGLTAQGMDKAKLLSTADEYLRILDTDARQFHSTVDTAMQEKVQGKKTQANEKTERIRVLSREITDLQDQIDALQGEIKENEEKIEASTGGYVAENARRAGRIQADIEKIKHYLH